MNTVLPSLIAYGQWLLANPSAAAHVGDIAMTGCPVQQQLSDRLMSLTLMGAHGVPSPVTVFVTSSTTSTTTTSGASSAAGLPAAGAPAGSPAAGIATVTATLTRASESTASDAGGQQLGASPALDNATADITLRLGADKRWRLCDVQPLQVVGADSDDDDLDIF